MKTIGNLGLKALKGARGAAQRAPSGSHSALVNRTLHTNPQNYGAAKELTSGVEKGMFNRFMTGAGNSKDVIKARHELGGITGKGGILRGAMARTPGQSNLSLYGGNAAAMAFPGYEAYNVLSSPGSNVGEGLGSALGGGLGYLAGSPLGMIGGGVMGAAGAAILGNIGKRFSNSSERSKDLTKPLHTSKNLASSGVWDRKRK